MKFKKYKHGVKYWYDGHTTSVTINWFRSSFEGDKCAQVHLSSSLTSTPPQTHTHTQMDIRTERKVDSKQSQNKTDSMHHVCCVKNVQQKSSMAEKSVNHKHSDHHFDANTVLCQSSCREVSQHFELCTEHSEPHCE
jgi:hypothetical protein